MKKCSLCGWDNAPGRTFCLQCGGAVPATSPLSPEERRRFRATALACRLAGVLVLVTGIALFFWRRTETDPDSPAFFIRLGEIVSTAGMAYALLRLGRYLKGRGEEVLQRK